MIFATPDDVSALQKEIEGQTRELTKSIGDCIAAGKISPSDGAPGDPRIYKDWKGMARRVIAFLNEEPTWIDANSQYERGIKIANDLQPWYDRVNKAGCQAPAKPSPPPAPLKGEGWVGDWGMLVMLALVVFGLHEAKGL